MIETKEAQLNTAANFGLPHNNSVLVLNFSGTPLNIFLMTQGSADPMQVTAGNRIGDSIAVRGVSIKAFFENAWERSRVYYRLMLLKGPRGDDFSRANIFKGDSNNKMMDVINTERYTIIQQRVFTISTSNPAPATVIPNVNGVPSAATPAGIGTRLVTMWIPGRRFGRGGVLQFENGTSNPKFFDYRIVIVAYDWFGTPQDINTVGRVNELFAKVYFKDA